MIVLSFWINSRTSPTAWASLLMLWVALASVLVCESARGAETSPPNFVIIMADDLGYGDLSCYGGWIETPHLDRMAEQGMRFTDFHSSGNVCSPTRAGLVTGRYQQRAGIPGVVYADPTRPVHYHGLQQHELTFAEALRDRPQQGYATAIFGKWHLGYDPKFNPVHHGFDEFRGYVSGNIDFFSHIDQAGNYDWWHQDQHAQEEGYVTHLITEHAVRFIEQHRDQPFCLYLPHEAPHYPYQGPGDRAERTLDSKFKTQGARQDIGEAYREMVAEMDRGVGEVLETLERLQMAENTLVLFFSDNGANRHGSNRPLRGAKGSNWEGGHRVPCLAVWPGKVTPGSVCHELAITLDVMPTLLEAADVDLPAEHVLDGVSLLPALAGEKLPPRQLVWNGKAIRDGSWKLVVGGKGGPRVGLYNLANDLGEEHNLADAHPDRVQTLQARLAEWTEDVSPGTRVQPRESAEAKARQAKRQAGKSGNE